MPTDSEDRQVPVLSANTANTVETVNVDDNKTAATPLNILLRIYNLNQIIYYKIIKNCLRFCNYIIYIAFFQGFTTNYA